MQSTCVPVQAPPAEVLSLRTKLMLTHQGLQQEKAAAQDLYERLQVLPGVSHPATSRGFAFAISLLLESTSSAKCSLITACPRLA